MSTSISRPALFAAVILLILAVILGYQFANRRPPGSSPGKQDPCSQGLPHASHAYDTHTQDPCAERTKHALDPCAPPADAQGKSALSPLQGLSAPESPNDLNDLAETFIALTSHIDSQVIEQSAKLLDEPRDNTRLIQAAFYDALNHSGHEASDLLAVIRTADQKQKTWLLEKLTERVESDEKPAVRRACVVGLTAFGRNARRTLADVLMSDDDRNVRKLAAYALGQLGTKEEVDALVQAVRRDSGALGVGRDLAAVAVTALGEIGGEEAARALHEIWNSEQLSRGCREQTLTALGVAGHPGALPILQTVLQQSNQLLRDNAAFALGQLASRNQDDPAILSRSLTLLRQYLSDPNPRVRVNAVDALGRLGRPDDIALLEARSGDDYAIELSYTEDGQVKTKSVYPVRQKATEAIAQIRTRHNLTK